MPLPKDDHAQRYSRQLAVPGWGPDGQRRLSESHVFIAGAGGLGSAASIYIAAAGVGKLTICDTDRVELSNLNRQVLYTQADIGHEKAPTAAARLRALNPGVEIVPTTREITPASACELARGADVILDCLDNLETRLALNGCSIATGIPMVYAAVSELTGHISFLHPPATPCLECFAPHTPPPVEPAIPGFTAGLVGALEAMEAVKFLTGIGDTLAGRLLIIEGAEPRFDVVTLERDPACPACGSVRR